MEQIYTIATVWLALAVVSSAIIAYHVRISIALGLLFAPFTYKIGRIYCHEHRCPGPFTLRHYRHYPDLCKPDGGDQDQMGYARPLRVGRAGTLVGQRGGAARLHCGDGSGGKRGKGRLLGAAAAHPDRRFSHPFYFLRAGTLVSLSSLVSAPLIFVALLAGKMISKIFGLYPVIALFRRERNERWYYTLLMSTGLTFGTISALYGLSHGIVTQGQYSFLVATVIASAVVPTLIAGIAFLPIHLLPQPEKRRKEATRENGLSEEG
jgi:glutathione-regulated potassium-efflux system ancillary protein KefC